MSDFWRFLGMLNAAVWIGASAFFSLAVIPDLNSPEAERLIGRPLAGLLARLVAEDFSKVQVTCAAVALMHFLVDWLHFGRPRQQVVLGILIGCLAVGLLNGAVLEPHLKHLHATRYGRTVLPEQRDRAARHFVVWRHIVGSANYLILAGVTIYLWRLANPPPGVRFVSTTKFRG